MSFAYLGTNPDPTGFTNNWLTSRSNTRLFSEHYGDFQVYQGETSGVADYRDILKSTIERTPVSDFFFGPANIKHLQFLICKLIKDKYGYQISPESQRPDILVTVMRSIYLQYALHLPNDIKKQVADLNLKVLNDIVPRVASNILMELSRQRDPWSQPLPIARSVNVSSAGTRTNRSVSDLFI